MIPSALEKALALASLLVLSVPILFLGILVRMTSQGPVLFSQVRVGQRQERFRILKFRTMEEGAENAHSELMAEQIAESGSFLLKRPADHRVTQLGRFLRKFHLDELPQLINVLRGEMSFVGPRPMLPSEVEHLTSGELKRFDVLPGISGLAQINGGGTLSLETYLNFDREMVEKSSPRLYFYVLFRTPGAALRGRG